MVDIVTNNFDSPVAEPPSCFQISLVATVAIAGIDFFSGAAAGESKVPVGNGWVVEVNKDII